MTARSDLADLLSGDHRTYDRFYAALGRFVAEFSDVEAYLQTVMWRAAGVKPPVAPAVFSGVRIDQAISFMNRIADAKRWPKRRRDEFSYLSQQLGIINKLRNDILHYGAETDYAGRWLVSNEKFIHTPERLRETYIDERELANATSDLKKI